jgi:hypothetical protein
MNKNLIKKISDFKISDLKKITLKTHKKGAEDKQLIVYNNMGIMILDEVKIKLVKVLDDGFCDFEIILGEKENEKIRKLFLKLKKLFLYLLEKRSKELFDEEYTMETLESNLWVDVIKNNILEIKIPFLGNKNRYRMKITDDKDINIRGIGDKENFEKKLINIPLVTSLMFSHVEITTEAKIIIIPEYLKMLPVKKVEVKREIITDIKEKTNNSPLEDDEDFDNF